MDSENATLGVRDATANDIPAIWEIYEPVVLGTAISFETETPSHPELRSRMGKSHEWLVYEGRDRVLAYSYAAPFHSRAGYRWSVEVSIYVADEARGRGVGRQLLDQLLDRLTRRGFVNAFAGITLPNPASVRLFESAGFEKVAHYRSVGFKLGRWHDVAWWQRQLRDPQGPPPQLE